MKTKSRKIGTIAEELAACRKAWAANPNATTAWCCHHLILIEPLTELAENRIAYILSDKAEHEQAVRLRNFRPVRVKLPPALAKARADLDKARAENADTLNTLHTQDWSDHAWDGQSIFA